MEHPNSQDRPEEPSGNRHETKKPSRLTTAMSAALALGASYLPGGAMAGYNTDLEGVHDQTAKTLSLAPQDAVALEDYLREIARANTIDEIKRGANGHLRDILIRLGGTNSASKVPEQVWTDARSNLTRLGVGLKRSGDIRLETAPEVIDNTAEAIAALLALLGIGGAGYLYTQHRRKNETPEQKEARERKELRKRKEFVEKKREDIKAAQRAFLGKKSTLEALEEYHSDEIDEAIVSGNDAIYRLNEALTQAEHADPNADQIDKNAVLAQDAVKANLKKLKQATKILEKEVSALIKQKDDEKKAAKSGQQAGKNTGEKSSVARAATAEGARVAPVATAAAAGAATAEALDGLSGEPSATGGSGLDTDSDRDEGLSDDDQDFLNSISDEEPSVAHNSVDEETEDLSKETQEETGEVDPLAEADVFIAYGRFRQAEWLVGKAIEQNPNDVELKTKMLEIHHALKDQEKFDALLADPQVAALEESEPEKWKEIKGMQEKLLLPAPAAEDELEVTGLDDEEDEFAGLDLQGLMGEPKEGGTPDAGGDSDGLGNLDDLVAEEGESGDKDDDDLDFSLDDDQIIAEGDELDYLDLGLDKNSELEGSGENGDLNELDFSDIDDGDDDLDALSAGLEDDNGEKELNLDLPLGVGEATGESPEGDDLDDLDGPASEEGEEGEKSKETPSDVDPEEVATKLDLAGAYVDMGDEEGARDILKEVLQEGTPEQKAKAQQILDDLE